MKTVKSILISIYLLSPYIVAILLNERAIVVLLLIANTVILILFLIKDKKMITKWKSWSLGDKITIPIMTIVLFLQVGTVLEFEKIIKKIKGRKSNE